LNALSIPHGCQIFGHLLHICIFYEKNPLII
jgi:hypothetical protein